MVAIIVFDVVSILLLGGGAKFILGLDKISAFVFSALITASVAMIAFVASLFDVPTFMVSLTTVPPATALSYVSLSSSLGLAPSTKRILSLALISEAAMILIFALTPMLSYAGRIEVTIPGTVVEFSMPGIYSLVFISFSITGSIISLMSMLLKKEWEKRWALILPSFILTIFSLTRPNIWYEAAKYTKENPLIALILWSFCVYLIAMAYVQLT